MSGRWMVHVYFISCEMIFMEKSFRFAGANMWRAQKNQTPSSDLSGNLIGFEDHTLGIFWAKKAGNRSKFSQLSAKNTGGSPVGWFQNVPDVVVVSFRHRATTSSHPFKNVGFPMKPSSYWGSHPAINRVFPYVHHQAMIPIQWKSPETRLFTSRNQLFLHLKVSRLARICFLRWDEAKNCGMKIWCDI